MYWVGLLTGAALAFWGYEIGFLKGEYKGRQFGKAVAYRLCESSVRPFCTPEGLNLPANVKELPFEALSRLP